ncbi:hypothetical protein AKO1_002608 [Acrasis kona]|uniref:Uncharacterized protein n=1 Tax=Acrasis kona TaxID=1008807 RepID=A0AAW2Z294_9EUKA
MQNTVYIRSIGPNHNAVNAAMIEFATQGYKSVGIVVHKMDPGLAIFENDPLFVKELKKGVTAKKNGIEYRSLSSFQIKKGKMFENVDAILCLFVSEELLREVQNKYKGNIVYIPWNMYEDEAMEQQGIKCIYEAPEYRSSLASCMRFSTIYQ